MRRRTLPSLLLATALALPAVAAELGVTTPVKDFRLPMFAPDGTKTWDLRGSEGVRRPEGIVELKDMWLRFYERPKEKPAPVMTVEIRSPLAFVHEKDRAAEGPGAIEIKGPSYDITGSGWRFEGAAQRRHITIRERVRVVFGEQLDSILR